MKISGYHSKMQLTATQTVNQQRDLWSFCHNGNSSARNQYDVAHTCRHDSPIILVMAELLKII